MSSSSAIKIFKKIKLSSFIYQWCRDDDNDDYMDCAFGDINYKIISSLLILLQKYDYTCDYYFIEKKKLLYNFTILK
jgi:hypothetical protein